MATRDFYFVEGIEDRCYTIQRISHFFPLGSLWGFEPFITIEKAIVDRTAPKYCATVGEFVENGDCNKFDCSGKNGTVYEPCNGKNGKCKNLIFSRKQSGVFYRLYKDGRKERIK